MKNTSPHKFHIPVMGLAYTIETPAKVAHYGISSVVSIIEDHLIEKMRGVLSRKYGFAFTPVHEKENDSRARRITAYLDLLDDIVQQNTARLRSSAFMPGSEIYNYFKMLPSGAAPRKKFESLPLLGGEERKAAELYLRDLVQPGSIDVNIMTKVDRTNYDDEGNALSHEYSDAHSALRGFAKSKLRSSVVFSAGLNPRLYGYCEQFPDFFPDHQTGVPRKRIILKVSDYRSALIQGKFLAKKGLLVSEFRIESGLNCGGHAFATEGLLLGPILEEFRVNRKALQDELLDTCNARLGELNLPLHTGAGIRITAQGGIGTGAENAFLVEHYGLDATGWGSPFLLVPEATTVDGKTLEMLSVAEPQDYYLSDASPLGVPFNNFRRSTSEEQRKRRIAKGRPGSPCYKKFLSSNTEFTGKPICTASRQYQDLRITQLTATIGDYSQLSRAIAEVTEKDCLCEGLGASALLANNAEPSHKLTAVAVCPGPNLAFFSGVIRLSAMVDHIYGRSNVLNSVHRPHVFVNELELYVKYLKREIEKEAVCMSSKIHRYLLNFRNNLLGGIDYYRALLPSINEVREIKAEMAAAFDRLHAQLAGIKLQQPLA